MKLRRPTHSQSSFTDLAPRFTFLGDLSRTFHYQGLCKLGKRARVA
jgi:hypothetical protein